MPKISNLALISFARFQAVLFGLVGLVCGVIYSIGGLIFDLIGPGLSYGTWLAFGALIGMPLLFFGAGFVVGLVQACLFNVFAKVFDGIRMDFTQ